MPLRLHLDTYLCLASHLQDARYLRTLASSFDRVRHFGSVNARLNTSQLAANTSVNEQKFGSCRQSENSSSTQWIPQDLLSVAVPPEPSTSQLPPLRPHIIPPVERSTIISRIHYLLDIQRPTPEASDELYTHFSRIHFSSTHSHALSVSELTAILYHLIRSRKLFPFNSRRDVERLRIVADELKQVIGDDAAAHQAIEARIFACSTTSRHRDVSSSHLDQMEKAFNNSYTAKALPKSSHVLEAYRMRINHLLDRCARAGDEKRFEMWWNLYRSHWLIPDIYAIMARMTLYIELGRLNTMMIMLESTLKRAAEETSESDSPIGKDGVSAIINFVFWTLAKRGHWKAIDSIYSQLRPSSAHPFETILSESAERERELASPSHFFDRSGPSNEITPIQIPTSLNLKPTRQIYSSLIKALTFGNHLVPALQILKHMLEDGVTPGVPEYMSLFTGFGRFGYVPPIHAGELVTAFPSWNDGFHIGNEATRIDRLSEIWERGSGMAPRFENSIRSEWTYELLRDLLEAFFKISPTPEENLAPIAKGVFVLLLATARTTNGDFDAVHHVWRRLNDKFGFGNAEGWLGWQEDARIRKLRAVLEGESADERDSEGLKEDQDVD